MSLFGRIARFREEHITGHAEPYLDAGEEIIHWVRAREPGSRNDGFVFVTPQRVIVYWADRSDGHSAVAWEEIDAWGVNEETSGGPVLALESEDGTAVAQLRVATHAMADAVSELLSHFTRLAPSPRRAAKPVPNVGEVRPVSDVHVVKEPGSIGGMTKRFLVTVLGGAMVVGGIIITPLPGPWSFPVVIAGLAVLGSEYDWAKDALDWARTKFKNTAERLKRRRSA
jgi:hypothetical protein